MGQAYLTRIAQSLLTGTPPSTYQVFRQVFTAVQCTAVHSPLLRT